MNPILTKLYYLRSFLKFRSYGRNISLSKNGKFIRPQEIILGDNVYINNSFHISARELIIGSNIMIGPGLVIECDNHIYNKIGLPMFKYNNEKYIKSVEIENDVWIGANVIILPGVSISEGCVIGAGSVVTKSTPPYSICIGNPCRPLKKRFNDNELELHLRTIRFSKYSFEEIITKWNLYNL